jgi:arylsulfatase A-like enzyme
MKKQFALLLTLILVCSTLLQAQKSSSKPPNIIVIFSDDHTQQTISAYGKSLMQTPNIDRIAKEGMIAKNAFVTNSICAPSRAVLLTGKYNHINGLKDNGPRRFFDGNQQQVQKLLKQKEYQTAWIGKWHLQTLPSGFDFFRILPDQGQYFQPNFINMPNDTASYKGYTTNLITEFSTNWLDKRDTSKPFFLVVGEKATHRNWMPDVEDLGAFDNIDFPYPANFNDSYNGREAARLQDMTVDKTMVLQDDLKINVNWDKVGPGMFARLDPTQKAAYKKYYTEISKQYEAVKNDSAALLKFKFERYLKDYLATAKSLDRGIGKILDYLAAHQLDENTVVIYASDQGFYMGEHGWFDKRFMYEESLRTPFVMRYPGQINPGTTLQEMIVNIDFAPTILNIAGIQTPSDMQGKSFLPLVAKGTPAAKKSFAATWRSSMYYHYYEYPQPHHVAPHFGIRTTRYKLIRFYGPHNDWELFDLQKDPTEMKNLINDPAYAKTIVSLKKELKDLMEHYQDFEALTTWKTTETTIQEIPK